MPVNRLDAGNTHVRTNPYDHAVIEVLASFQDVFIKSGGQRKTRRDCLIATEFGNRSGYSASSDRLA